MNDHQRRCPTTWSIRDGLFETTSWPRVESGTHLARVLAAIAQIPLGDRCRVWLRGSTLEELAPHPGADIDLLVTGDGEHVAAAKPGLAEGLVSFGRPVEIVALAPEVLFANPILRMLIAHRALLVHGSSEPVAPVRPDATLAQMLWRQHAPLFLPPRLAGPVRARLVHVKSLLRAVGVVRLLQCGEYARDLRACAAWAHEVVPQSAAVLARALADLEDDAAPPLHIDDAIHDLEVAFGLATGSS